MPLQEFKKKLCTYSEVEHLLQERVSTINFLGGGQDSELLSYYTLAYNYKPIVVNCYKFTNINDVIVALYKTFFPESGNKSKTKIIEEFYSFLKKTIYLDFVIFLENLTFVTNTNKFKTSKFFIKLLDFQKVNQSAKIVFLHCPNNKVFISNITLLNNTYLHQQKNTILEYIFFNSSLEIQNIIYNLLNNIKLGRLLSHIKEYIPFYHFNSISLLNIKTIELNQRTLFEPNLGQLSSVSKQLLALILNNITKISTIKLLTGQFFNIYQEKVQLLPFLVDLCNKRLINCNKGLNCNHSQTENINHCNCWLNNSANHSKKCKICVFKISSGMSYQINLLLKDFNVMDKFM